ncbi:hypothetical protein Tco_0877671 [Tanacetum coccineum]|uniref:Uncharacterized protein n=1 Tax=Tanacetum coccineum TaxID=301880 RepID=A0ABQ5BVU1_9ASTR
MSSDNASSAVTYTSVSSDSNGPSSWGIPLVNAGELPEMDPFAMSSDNASSAVTYTSVSSDSNGPSSWGIPLVNAGELPEMDPYEELDEHVPVYVPEPEHPEYHAPSDDDIQVEDQPYADDASSTAESPRYIANSDSMEEDTDADSIDYPDEPEDGKEDDDEDPEEDPTPANSSVVPVIDLVPSAGDTEAFETDESTPTPRSPHTRVSFSQTRLSMIHMRDDIPEGDMPPRRRFILTAPPPGCDVAESSAAATARAPRGQYDFVDTVEAGQGLTHSPGHDARTIARAADRAEGIYRQESEDFYTQLDAQTDRKDIRLEIDVVRGQRTAYETELHEVRQAYHSFETRNRALLARLETLETHMSRMEWQRQRAKDDAVRQMMRTYVLEARAQIDTMEDTGSSC